RDHDPNEPGKSWTFARCHGGSLLVESLEVSHHDALGTDAFELDVVRGGSVPPLPNSCGVPPGRSHEPAPGRLPLPSIHVPGGLSLDACPSKTRERPRQH